MIIISESVDSKVIDALDRGYSEHQVARMFSLRVAAVRRIEGEYSRKGMRDMFSDTLRRRETPLEFGRRLHDDIFNTYMRQQQSGLRVEIPKLDYAGLEARVMAGFFTPNGVPTPAFWGFISQYVKKSGHAMLDILHDQEIYAPEQLQRALDIDSQLEDMTQEQLIALLRRVTNAVYANAIEDPTRTRSDVQNGE